MSTVPRAIRLRRMRIAGVLALCAACCAVGTPAAAIARRPIGELKTVVTLHLAKTADWVAITDSAVWVGSTGPNAVHALDPTTNGRIATVELPGEPCAGLAVGFDSLWVPLCGRRGGLARVDLTTHRLAAVYDVGPATAEGGVTSGAGHVWMVLKTGMLARIDPADGTIRARVTLPSGSVNPRYAAGVVWVTRATGAEVTAIDATTGAVLEHLPTGPRPRFLTAADGAVWTLNQGDGSLTRIDPSGREPQRTLALGTPGAGGDITDGAGRIWTTFQGVPLSVVDAASPALLCQWQGPGGDSLGFGFGSIWLTDYHAGTISRIALSDLPPDCGAGPSTVR